MDRKLNAHIIWNFASVGVLAISGLVANSLILSIFLGFEPPAFGQMNQYLPAEKRLVLAKKCREQGEDRLAACKAMEEYERLNGHQDEAMLWRREIDLLEIPNYAAKCAAIKERSHQTNVFPCEVLGQLYESTGDFKRARESYRKVCEISGDCWHLGDIDEKHGTPAQVLESLEKTCRRRQSPDYCVKYFAAIPADERALDDVRSWLRKACLEGGATCKSLVVFEKKRGDVDQLTKWAGEACDSDKKHGCFVLQLISQGGNSRARDWLAERCKSGHSEACDAQFKPQVGQLPSFSLALSSLISCIQGVKPACSVVKSQLSIAGLFLFLIAWGGLSTPQIAGTGALVAMGLGVLASKTRRRGLRWFLLVIVFTYAIGQVLVFFNPFHLDGLIL